MPEAAFSAATVGTLGAEGTLATLPPTLASTQQIQEGGACASNATQITTFQTKGGVAKEGGSSPSKSKPKERVKEADYGKLLRCAIEMLESFEPKKCTVDGHFDEKIGAAAGRDWKEVREDKVSRAFVQQVFCKKVNSCSKIIFLTMSPLGSAGTDTFCPS